MPIYVYRSDDGQQYEFFQGVNEPALKNHPESGIPIRRIIVNNIKVKTQFLRRGTKVNKNLAAAKACGCASRNHSHSHS